MDANVDLGLIGQKIAIQSFAEAGNSLLGHFIEQVTGVFVGSDANIQQVFDQTLGIGQLGQAHTGDNQKVWFTKTNYPFEKRNVPFNAQKMIIVARSPISIIIDTADNKNTLGFNDRLQVDDLYNQDHPQWWDKWIHLQA